GGAMPLHEFWRRLFAQKHRPRKPGRPWLLLEALEPRLAPALFTWDGGGDGTTWADPGNWDSPGNNLLAGAADDAVINVAGDITIVHDAGTTSIRSLNSSEAITLSGGSFTLSQNSTIDDTFTVAGGTLNLPGSLTLGGTGTLRNQGSLTL